MICIKTIVQVIRAKCSLKLNCDFRNTSYHLALCREPYYDNRYLLLPVVHFLQDEIKSLFPSQMEIVDPSNRRMLFETFTAHHLSRLMNLFVFVFLLIVFDIMPFQLLHKLATIKTH